MKKPQEEIQFAKQARWLDIHAMLEQLRPGMAVQVDGGRWRELKHFEVCPIMGRVIALILKDEILGEVEIKPELMTGISSSVKAALGSCEYADDFREPLGELRVTKKELYEYKERLDWLMRRTGMTVTQIDKELAKRDAVKKAVLGGES
jgi:hypothetical protein